MIGNELVLACDLKSGQFFVHPDPASESHTIAQVERIELDGEAVHIWYNVAWCNDEPEQYLEAFSRHATVTKLVMRNT